MAKVSFNRISNCLTQNGVKGITKVFGDKRTDEEVLHRLGKLDFKLTFLTKFSAVGIIQNNLDTYTFLLF